MLCIASAGRERPLLRAAVRVRAGPESSQDRCCLGGPDVAYGIGAASWGCENAG
jgi:hypothetical protein